MEGFMLLLVVLQLMYIGLILRTCHDQLKRIADSLDFMCELRRSERRPE